MYEFPRFYATVAARSTLGAITSKAAVISQLL
jgi:hypothetical protein